jgi:nucleoside-diphosphate-sugar epimerase
VGGKAMQNLGFTPKVELLDGLREQIKWQNSRLKNPNNS